MASHGELTLISGDGAPFRAYAAVPAGSARAGFVILPDIRGLHPYYEDLSVRFAEAGFHAIAVDYYGRTAGTAHRDESFDWKSHLGKVTPEQIAADVHVALRRVRSEAGRHELPMFTVGFCFGGASSWRQSGDTPGLAGCVGFYGGRPMERAAGAIPRMTAPLLMLLAGDDPGTPPSEFEEFAQRVRARGLQVESRTYPGAPHSYFDRSFADHEEACADSWRRILAFADRNTPAAETLPAHRGR